MQEFDNLKKLLKRESADELIQEVDSLLVLHKSNPYLHFYRSFGYLYKEKVDEAINDINFAIDLIPENAEFLSQRAVLYFHKNQLTEALADMDLAAKLEPENPYRYSSRAFIKDAMKDIDGAIADYEKAIELDPTDAVAHNNLGMLQEKLGWKDKAMSNFKKADTYISEVDFEKQVDDLLIETKISKSKAEKPRMEETQTASKAVEILDAKEFNKKLKFADYLQLLKKIITDKKTRTEFIQFLKSGFKK